MLSEHFAEGVRRVRRKLNGAPLRIVNYDWHGTMANLKEKGTVEALWAILAAILPQVRSLCGPGALADQVGNRCCRCWVQSIGIFLVVALRSCGIAHCWGNELTPAVLGGGLLAIGMDFQCSL